MKAAPQQNSYNYHTPDMAVGFRHVKYVKGEALQAEDVKYNHLVFVVEGEVEIGLNEIHHNTFCAGQMAYVPGSFGVRGVAVSDAELLVLTYDNSVTMCQMVNVGLLRESVGQIAFEFKPLPMRQPLKEYVELMIFYLNSNAACTTMQRVKQMELFLLLRHYYTMEQRAMFFYLSTFKNNDFMSQILANYKLVKNAEELASKCGYNIMTFHRLFKENLGQTPYKWMQLQQAGAIRSRLIDDNMSLMAIAQEFRFSSVSHLCTYTKRYLGATPMKIRKEARG